jgi:hypothetical protein
MSTAPDPRAPWAGPLELPGVGEIPVLYPDLCYAPLRLVEAASLEAFAAAVIAARPELAVAAEEDMVEFPLASLIVSRDVAARFDPDLSIREPLEVQAWADGRATLEIEFVGLDVREVGFRWETMEAVLAEWADAHGLKLLNVRNDRGRSLADVWNARFALPDTAISVGEAVALAGRAIDVAELHAGGSVTVERMLRTLRDGDAQALLRLSLNPGLLFRPGFDRTSEEDQFRLATDVGALANAAIGGLLVLGLSIDDDGQVALQDSGDDPDEAILGIVRESVYPPPEGIETELVEAKGPQGECRLRVVAVPRQDRVVKPFLVHGAGRGGEVGLRFVSIAERHGGDVQLDGIAALHAAIATGRALLRGSNGAADGSPRKEDQ